MILVIKYFLIKLKYVLPPTQKPEVYSVESSERRCSLAKIPTVQYKKTSRKCELTPIHWRGF
jgi:hypothetical protein